MANSDLPFKFCPYCDAVKTGSSSVDALQRVSEHVDKAHPDLPNNIKEDLEDGV